MICWVLGVVYRLAASAQPCNDVASVEYTVPRPITCAKEHSKPESIIYKFLIDVCQKFSAKIHKPIKHFKNLDFCKEVEMIENSNPLVTRRHKTSHYFKLLFWSSSSSLDRETVMFFCIKDQGL